VRTLPNVSTLTAALLAVGLLAACGKSSTKTSAMSADLKRDLDAASSSSLALASNQSSAQFPLTETPIASAPAPAKKIVKAQGPKAIRSPRPTVRAEPEQSVATETEQAQVEVTEIAAAPTTDATTEAAAPAVPRPSPIPISAVPAGGRGNGGSSTGEVLGTIFGAVIRGGGVDDDHCDPHRGRRRPNVTIIGQTRGGYGGGVMMGGIGGMRTPGTYSRPR
jgi:hypothetical protein